MEFSALTFILIALSILVIAIIVIPLGLFSYIYWKDRRQSQHAILRNYPLLGKIRYTAEKAGPELRQYLFDADTAGKPFSR